MKNGMKKILFLLFWIPAIIACTEKNTPVDTTGDTTSVDTTTTTPADTTITTTDTIRISWSGTAVTVEGVNSGVTVTETNGYVTVNSTVKDITYILSGSGNGQLTIYGTNRHQLVLSNLTLTCSDGPAINNQCKKSCFVVLEGSNTLADGSTYAASDEDRKAAFFSEGQMIFSGSGSLTVNGNYKHAIASDDYIQFTEGTGSLTLKAASDGIHANDALYFDGGTFAITAGSDGVQCDSSIVIKNGAMTITASGDGIQSDTANITVSGGEVTITKADDKGITAFGNIVISGGTIRINSQYKCLKAGKKENNVIVSAGSILISGGDIQAVCTGTSTSSGFGGGHGGGPGGGWGWGDSSSDETSTPEAIEAKGTVTINGGYVYAQSSDDAINSGGALTVNGGFVCAYSTSNDGLDANDNLYIKGGVVYAVGAGGAERSIDALENRTLYISGGTLFCIGDLESGASLSQNCYQASSWSKNTWYSVTVGNEVYAFKTPSSGGTKLVVSGASTPSLKSGVTPSGTAIFNGMGYYPATFTGGTNVSLSSYTSSRW